jgi:LPS-assembly protein
MPLTWRGLHLLPTYELRTTYYGSRSQNGKTVGDPIVRKTHEFTLDIRPPSFERIFDSPSKALGEKLKHVVEPYAEFRLVDGVKDFNEMLHFDERDLLADTQEFQYGITNRVFSKRSDGVVREILSWDLRQAYYFDPTFGGALVPGQRNVFASTLDVTGYTFLDQPRRFSPIASTVRFFGGWNYSGEVRNDYDPVRQKIVNSGVTFNFRHSNLFGSLSDFFVNSAPDLQPRSSDQIRTQLGYGSGNRRGFNVATTFVYDLRETALPYTAIQANYNFDCCGVSIEFQRMNFGNFREETGFRLSVSFANIGTFGNLKRQERIF